MRRSAAESELTVNRSVQTFEDVMTLLDLLFEESADRWTDRGGAAWWDRFYADRGRGVPFFRDAPDESLVGWQDAGLLGVEPGARVLELGCGPGRNAVWLAQHGATVDALDLSQAALDWGRERAAAARVEVTFVRADVLTWPGVEGGYDLVVDSGCFHHLPPHRRLTYRTMLERTLRPDGRFALACFAAGGMGTEATDVDLYRTGSLAGGLAYTADELRATFGWLTEVELRRMTAQTPDDAAFGEDFLWAGLFRR